MPTAVGLEIVVVLALLALLVAAFVAARWSRRRETRPTARRARRRPARGGPAGREALGGRIRDLFARRGGEPDVWRELEDLLVRADVGPVAAASLVGRVRERFAPGDDPARLVAAEVEALFAGDPRLRVGEGHPSIVLVVGVNGSGKTTTIGKIAHRLVREGRTVCLAASDTFRAAAVEQLATWAERAGADLVAQQRGADPGAVAFDALQAARARRADVLIVDTAGRLHTRTPLMDELAKVRRVLEKAGGTIDETLLVLDATTGQNGIVQARTFTEAAGVSGIVLTKLDGTARGGVVVAVREALGIPVKLVGSGEGIEDLEPFDPERFARALADV
ncbi:MAG TPA: signal recognition particle-docking protein FtsY [Actinomycetota bacterium]|nr:signal recognition particle-docking protein FtsY [Actinomycetota bacterium]